MKKILFLLSLILIVNFKLYCQCEIKNLKIDDTYTRYSVGEEFKRNEDLENGIKFVYVYANAVKEVNTKKVVFNELVFTYMYSLYQPTFTAGKLELTFSDNSSLTLLAKEKSTNTANKISIPDRVKTIEGIFDLTESDVTKIISSDLSKLWVTDNRVGTTLDITPKYVSILKEMFTCVHGGFLSNNIQSPINSELNKEVPQKLSLSEQNAKIYYQKAQEFFKNKDYREALAQINLSIDALPNYSGSYYYRGFINMYGFKNFEKAIDDFTKSIQMNPDFKWSYFYRGMAYNNLQNNIEAIKDFTKVINLDNENTDAYFMRGLLKSKMNDLNGAIDDYNEIIKREKTAKATIYKISTVYNNKAYCLVGLRKYREALPIVNKALQIDESEWFIWDTRGEIYYN